MIFLNQQHVLDELVFEGRNQSYGAYVLRKSYPNHLKKAMAAVIAFFSIVWLLTYLLGKPKPIIQLPAKDELTMITVDLPELPEEIIIEKPSLGGSASAASQSGVFTIVRDTLIIPSEVLPAVIPGIGDSLFAQGPSVVSTSGGLGLGNDSSIGGNIAAAITQPFVNFAEKMPSFPGGNEAMFKYINQETAYPNQARENGIEGRVMLSFVVQPNGAITNIKVLQGIGFGCDAEAVRVVSEMPYWLPGMQNGKALPVQMNLPFYFKLE